MAHASRNRSPVAACARTPPGSPSPRHLPPPDHANKENERTNKIVVVMGGKHAMSFRDSIRTVFFTRSDPARSTRWNLDVTSEWPPPPPAASPPASAGRACVSVRVMIACDRDDSSFMAVDAVERASSPAAVAA